MSQLEIWGFITGAVSVWLAVKENVWNWPAAFANAVVFFLLFYHARLYADMGLQIIFGGIAVLGWYRWLYGGTGHTELPISHVSRRDAIVLSVLAVVSTIALALYLRRINDAAPFPDAFTTVLSLVGQYLLTKKVIENWHVWIVADVLYIFMYIRRELFLTSVLYVIFLLMCIAGLVEWRRTFRQTSMVVGSSH